MYSKEAMIESFRIDTELCKHMVSKIPADKMDWKMGEKMRTIQELLQYMCRMAKGPIDILLHGYLPERHTALREGIETRDIRADFDALMDEQLEVVIEYITNATDEHLDEEIHLFGRDISRRAFFLNVPVKNYTAYRMQLFQYLKWWLGMSDLDTSNLWLGVDAS